MESYTYSCAGKVHTDLNMPNEDRVVILAKDDLIVSVIADGAGSKKAGKDAAQLIVPVFAEWIYTDFDKLYYRNGDFVRGEAVRIVDSCLKAYAQSYDYEETDLACTLMATAMDSEGRCLCLHLGDGIVLRRMLGDDINRAEIVSPPENGLTPQETYLTMNCNMWKHIRFCRWKDPETECIICLSDGAQTHVVTLDDTEGWSITASCTLDGENMLNHLMHQQPVDDYSFTIISK